MAIAAFSSFYKVDFNEKVIVLRLGKYLKTTSPGPHFKLPFGIDRIKRVKVTQLYEEQFGFKSISTARKTIISFQQILPSLERTISNYISMLRFKQS